MTIKGTVMCSGLCGLILYLVTGHPAHDHVSGNTISSAKVLVLPRVATEEMGVGANLTPLLEIGNLCVRRGFGADP